MDVFELGLDEGRLARLREHGYVTVEQVAGALDMEAGCEGLKRLLTFDDEGWTDFVAKLKEMAKELGLEQEATPPFSIADRVGGLMVRDNPKLSGGDDDDE